MVRFRQEALQVVGSIPTGASAVLIALLSSAEVKGQPGTPDQKSETSGKLFEACQIADGLIYRHEKLDRSSSSEFLRKVVALDLKNLKLEADHVNRGYVEDECYAYLFVDFPKEFRDYLECYLPDEIAKNISRADKMMRNNTTVAALYSVDTALNTIAAALLITPNEPQLKKYMERAEGLKSKIASTH